MCKIDSTNWNHKLGICEKHLLPQTPCPACLAENDKDVFKIPCDIVKYGLDCFE